MIWRWIPYQVNSPIWNMALDEAILMAHKEGKVPPTLRFYGWKPAALSIGYFQKVDRVVNRDQLETLSIQLVRRMTGGRAVLHDKELTYSLIVSEKIPPFATSVSLTYRLISQGLLAGFQQLGLEASLSPPQSARKKDSSANCFDNPSDYELVVEGRKVVGSAQTRKEGVLLQHGSILLDIELERLFSVLRFPSEAMREQMKGTFLQKAVAIHQLSKRRFSMQEIQEAFYTGFRNGMRLTLEVGSVTPYEKQLATDLMKFKYGHGDWIYRR